MKKILLSIILITTLSLSAFAQDYKVVGYVTTYSALYPNPALIPFSKVTHINIAFINPTNNSGTINLSTTRVKALVTAAHNNNVKVLVSLAGALNSGSPTYGYLKTIISDSTSRVAFEDKLVTFISTNDLDGLDIDIETDLLASLCKNGSYQKFITGLKAKLPSTQALTAALGSGYYADFVPKATLELFDWINVMAYDKYGTWTGIGEHASYDDFILDEDYYLNTRKINFRKIVMGVPFYGYGWSEGKNNVAASYATLVNLSSDAIEEDYYMNPSTGYEYYYNGKKTMLLKTKEVYNQGLGGIMIWELSQDAAAPNSLLDVIQSVIPTSVKDELLQPGTHFIFYPNPAKNNLHIESTEPGTYTMTNMEGQDILSGQIDHELKKDISIQHIPIGMYILKFSTAKETIIKKIITE